MIKPGDKLKTRVTKRLLYISSHHTEIHIQLKQLIQNSTSNNITGFPNAF